MVQHTRWSDAGMLAWTLLFFSWLILDVGGDRWASTFDFVLFGVMGPTVALLQWRVSGKVNSPRERLAWRFLAAASLSRFVSGSVWGILVALSGSTNDPAWMTVLASGYLVFGILGLLTFPGTSRRPVDRLRFRLDAGIVLLGSLLVVWFFALGPFIRSGSGGDTVIAHYIYTVGDSVTVILAAALYLRSGSMLNRTVAVLMLAAFTMQVVPDIVFWSGNALESYKAGDAIAAWWFGVWILKWFAARVADGMLAAPGQRAACVSTRYRSGLVPFAFLLAAGGLLLFKLRTGETSDLTLFIVASALLANLLVARQAVELRERDALLQAINAEKARFRALLTYAYDAVVVLDEGLHVRYASPATERLLGRAEDSVEGWSFLPSLHPDDVSALQRAMHRSGSEPQSFTVRVRGVSREWRTLHGHLVDRRSDPAVGGYVLNALDKTREARLTSGLREAREVEALGVLAGGLAHDLNNILTVIASHVEFLETDAPQGPQVRSDLRVIRGATDRATALTRGLLALSRRKSATREPIDIGAFVRERIATRGNHIRWLASIVFNGESVRVDPAALGPVVDSLFDAAESDGGQVQGPEMHLETVLVDSHESAVLRLDPGAYVVLRIGDNVNEPADAVEDAVAGGIAGEWDLAPADLALLMALASLRENGGTLTRERVGHSSRMAMYLPAAA
jgi:PAS domain S-box-containing protein